MLTVKEEKERTESRGGGGGGGDDGEECGRADMLEDKKALRMRGMLGREERRTQLI